jgi:5'-nucleotidase (lipoprotein e(P4) family)
LREFIFLAAIVTLSGCAIGPAQMQAQVAPVQVPMTPPATMLYLYGSGEAAALSRQAYSALTAFVTERVRTASQGSRTGVVLTPDAKLAAPRFAGCGDKPLAIVLDGDETTILNLGFEADQASRGGAYDAARWNRWERTGGDAVMPVPGAVDALQAVRALGVTVVFISNRSAENAAYTERTLTKLGLGPARHGTTLFLAGDDATGSRKDQRRAKVADRYCVVAMGGDQLGDFSDLFNAIDDPAQRRAAADQVPVAALWGKGWFMLPNSVYGPALKGDMNAVFPVEKRWRDPVTPTR